MTEINNECKKVSRYGLIVPIDHKYPEQWKQTLRVRWREVLKLFGLGFR